jgi:hypothetical protein
LSSGLGSEFAVTILSTRFCGIASPLGNGQNSIVLINKKLFEHQALKASGEQEYSDCKEKRTPHDQIRLCLGSLRNSGLG